MSVDTSSPKVQTCCCK